MNMTNGIFYKVNMTVERLNEISIFESFHCSQGSRPTF